MFADPANNIGSLSLPISLMLTAKGGLKPGVKVTIGGEEYTAPQMNFGSVRAMANLDRKSASFVNDLLGFVLMESLKRNYDGVNAVWLNETLEGSEMDGAADSRVGNHAGERPDQTGRKHRGKLWR